MVYYLRETPGYTPDDARPTSPTPLESKAPVTIKAETLPTTVVLEQTGPQAGTGPEDTASKRVATGEILGCYRIEGVLGEGGMGVVYKAYDTLLNRTVALKVLPPHLLRNQDFLHRFRTEAQAQARLKSPNVVTLYALLEIPSGLVLVMEYVEGRTLDKRIAEGPLSVDEAVHVFEQILQGVDCAHRMGIVHRDLKPGNIFITSRGEIKIMDFGVARIIDNRDQTTAGSMLGTLLYIPPEQINGKAVDFRSDVYTLGISLFEAVTGRLPFERTTDYGLMHAHIVEKPPNPRALRRDVPKPLETVILRAMEKDPARRFQSAHEFREALLRHAGSKRLRAALQHAATLGSLHQSLLPPAWRASLFDRRSKIYRTLVGLFIDSLLIAAVLALLMGLGLLPGLDRLRGMVAASDPSAATHAAGNDRTGTNPAANHNLKPRRKVQHKTE
jgi:serine/threonine-protein kinase